MDIKDEKSDDHKRKLVRRAIEVVYAIEQPIKTWMPLVNLSESGIDDLAFPILINCLKDNVVAIEQLRKIKSESIQYHNIHLSINAFIAYCERPLPIFNELSEAEQYLLNIVRDRCVHGYLNGLATGTRNSTFVKNGKIEKFNLTPKQAAEKFSISRINSREQIAPIRRRITPFLNTYVESVADVFGEADHLTAALMQGMIAVDG